MDKNNNMVLIAIVAIVAIVGIVVLFMNSGSSRVATTGSNTISSAENVGGMATQQKDALSLGLEKFIIRQDSNNDKEYTCDNCIEDFGCDICENIPLLGGCSEECTINTK